MPNGLLLFVAFALAAEVQDRAEKSLVVMTMFSQHTRELGWFVKVGMTTALALATVAAKGEALFGRTK